MLLVVGLGLEWALRTSPPTSFTAMWPTWGAIDGHAISLQEQHGFLICKSFHDQISEIEIGHHGELGVRYMYSSFGLPCPPGDGEDAISLLAAMVDFTSETCEC